MTDPDLPTLSKSELDLMKVLWREGESTARAVHDRLGGGYDWAYSTTRTFLQRMVKKGFLERRSFHGVYLYSPLISKPVGLARSVRDFAERILELDPGVVVALFARSETLTEDEIHELTELLEGVDAERGDDDD